MRPLPPLHDLAGRSVTVMGLGRFGGGVEAVRFLARRGAAVTVTDQRPESELRDSLKKLDNCRLKGIFTGGHPDEAFRGCEILVVNPAVKPRDVHVRVSFENGVLVTSEIELFLQHNPAFTIAVTGSNGKSTTSQLIHDLLAQTERIPGEPARPTVWLGGNMGRSLLPQVDALQARDVVVVELSSFQLHSLRNAGFRPDVAVVTGFAANHLDWHGSLEHYRKSKHVISQSQTSTDTLVLPDDLDDWPGNARRLRFGLNDSGEDGVYIEDDTLIVRDGTFEDAERLTIPATLRGNHNRRNLAAAVAACRPATSRSLEIKTTLNHFQPLPHRLQLVAQAAQRSFIDDSSATTPESTIAALKSLRSGCVLIAGGHDKGAPLDELAKEIVRSARGVVAIGNTAGRLVTAIEQAAGETSAPPTQIADDFPAAFQHAVALSQPGDIVLLSPGFASFGWFEDYRDRGHQFSARARQWCALQDQSP